MWSLGPDAVYRSSVLAELPWIEHGFGTRRSENWPGPYVSVKQIHSNFVVEAGADEGDALICSEPGQLVGIRTADCVPILIAAEEVCAVAAVHAGWRGTSGEIAIAAVTKLREMYGAAPGRMRVAIGPAIGACCYEVGPEVINALAGWIPANDTFVDLVEANLRQLEIAGISGEKIDFLGRCCKCDREFHSYRRDQERSGRMVAAIGLKEKSASHAGLAPRSME